MKNAILILLPLLIIQPSSAIAGVCRPLEYAELKDTPTDGLVKTYCVYEKLAKLKEDLTVKLQGLVLEGVQKGLSSSESTISDTQKDADEAAVERDECYDQVSKLTVALENRHAPVPSRCDKF